MSRISAKEMGRSPPLTAGKERETSQEGRDKEVEYCGKASTGRQVGETHMGANKAEKERSSSLPFLSTGSMPPKHGHHWLHGWLNP